MKNSTLINKSRYVAGGITEVNRTALEWWERAEMQRDTSDTTYVIERKVEGRLDLIAQAFLGDTRLWWLIAQYNALLDPHLECSEGRVLRIPTKERAQTMIKGKLGGYDSTRELSPMTVAPIV